MDDPWKVPYNSFYQSVPLGTSSRGCQMTVILFFYAALRGSSGRCLASPSVLSQNKIRAAEHTGVQ